jgi:pimeloyl-ACP methyl ester carboxylesterase
MPYVRLDNLGSERIFYALHRRRETPDEAPALVCVHGAGGSHLNWPAEMRRLPGATVYALDLPGHGQSSGAGRRTIGEYVAVLVSFLEALHLADAVIVGHSMGGAVALEMALSHPERVRGLVLVGSGARLRVAPAILQGLLDDFEGMVKHISDWVYGPSVPDELKRLSQELLAETSPTVMHGDFLACDAFDVVARLGEIRAPTLVITGAADRMTPVKYARFLAQNIRGAQLVLLEDAGHMVMLERPQEVAEAVARFVASIASNQTLTVL